VQFKRVLAAVDPAPGDAAHESMNKKLIELGESIAAYESGEFHVAHAWQLLSTTRIKSKLKPGEFAIIEKNAEAEVAAAFDELLIPFGMTHRSGRAHLVRREMRPAAAISALAKQLKVDLIVIGTVARSGVHGVMTGNTSEHVIDRAECPVLTIKPDQYNSPGGE